MLPNEAPNTRICGIIAGVMIVYFKAIICALDVMGLLIN